ncbi:MAG: hypothetical protein Ct9H90mP16_02480 [Candidatus Poseidoniales archaeon]|nr:MAG: hypothetical protein Ct9H90mP16_02480 [Candidatus Poseidoniales archaeon]
MSRNPQCPRPSWLSWPQDYEVGRGFGGSPFQIRMDGTAPRGAAIPDMTPEEGAPVAVGH